MAQHIHLLDLHLHLVPQHVGPAVLATHQAVLPGAVFIPIVLERAHVHQPLHLGGRHLHEEAIALHPADHSGKHLAHQRFGLAGLEHGQQVCLELAEEAPPAVQSLHQPMLEHLLVRAELARGQQGPVDAAQAAIGGEVNTCFVAHAGPVLALGEQQHQLLLVP